MSPSDLSSVAPVSRRQIAAALLGAGIAAPLMFEGASAQTRPRTPPSSPAPEHPALAAMKQLTVGMLIFPGMTALDMVGPQLPMKGMMKSDVHLVWKTKEPVMTDSGFAIVPTATFAECPRDLDILCAPGGPRGTRALLEDDETLDFIADRGSRAKYVTSVCTGSVILGAAGLLKGYRAASYWGTRDILPLFGAIPDEGRVVVDRNRITGGGVTAGIDFGLYLAGMLRGKDHGEMLELIYEYDPQPPFGSGSPRTARPAIVERVRGMLAPAMQGIRTAAAAQAAKRVPK